jgi:hypothetical protein
MKVTPWTPRLHEYHATIDGEDVNANFLCNEASEEEGYIVCTMFTRTPTGGKHLIVGEDGAKTYTRYGSVVITPPRGGNGE